MTASCAAGAAGYTKFFLSIRFTFVRRLYVPKFSSIPCLEWDSWGVGHHTQYHQCPKSPVVVGLTKQKNTSHFAFCFWSLSDFNPNAVPASCPEWLVKHPNTQTCYIYFFLWIVFSDLYFGRTIALGRGQGYFVWLQDIVSSITPTHVSLINPNSSLCFNFFWSFLKCLEIRYYYNPNHIIEGFSAKFIIDNLKITSTSKSI